MSSPGRTGACPFARLLAVRRRTVAVIRVTPLLALRVFFDRNRVVRLAIAADLDVRQTFAMAAAGMRRLRSVRHRMLAELTGGEYWRFGLLRGSREKHAKKSHHSPHHRADLVEDMSASNAADRWESVRPRAHS